MRKLFVALAFFWSSALSTVAIADDWTGFYVGAHGGYGWGDSEVDLTHSSGAIHYNDPFLPGDEHPDFSDYNGWFAGGQAGFNVKIAPGIIVGLEADVSGADLGDDLTTAISKQGARWDISSNLDVFGTVRGRLGYLVNDQLLAYGTGGFAWGRVDLKQATTFYDVNTGQPQATDSEGGRTSGTVNHLGWTIGAGLEYRLAAHWTLKTEYLFVDLGKEDYALTGTNKPPSNPAAVPYVETFAGDVTFHSVRVGLNYGF